MPVSTRTPTSKGGSSRVSTAALPGGTNIGAVAVEADYGEFATQAMLDMVAQIDRNLDLADQHLSRA